MKIRVRARAGDLGLAGIIVLADQGTKALVRAMLSLHASVTIVPGFLDFTHVRNTGAAFGILNRVEFPFKTPLLIGVAVVALVGIGIYATHLPTKQRLARFGLALILGGAIGNLIDRIRTGYVLDFVDVYWRDYHFWAFNVADSAITVGVAAIILDLLLEPRRANEDAPRPSVHSAGEGSMVSTGEPSTSSERSERVERREVQPSSRKASAARRSSASEVGESPRSR